MIAVTALSRRMSATPALSVAADRMVAVDDDLDVEAVVAKQDRGAAPAGQQRRVAKRAAVGDQPSVLDPVGVTSAWLPPVSGAISSRKARPQATTRAPRSAS